MMRRKWTDQFHTEALLEDPIGKDHPEIAGSFNRENDALCQRTAAGAGKVRPPTLETLPQVRVESVQGVGKRKGMTDRQTVGIDDDRVMAYLGRIDSDNPAPLDEYGGAVAICAWRRASWQTSSDWVMVCGSWQSDINLAIAAGCGVTWKSLWPLNPRELSIVYAENKGRMALCRLGFEIMGPMSSMISRFYDQLTTNQQSVRRLTPVIGPDKLGRSAPGRVADLTLPLWVFYVRPGTPEPTAV